MERKLELLAPWEPPHSPSGLVAELCKEVGPEHPLYGREAKALAVACDRDDVLFEIGGPGSPGYAVVHLTWSQRQEEHPWPRTRLFETLDQWIEWMKTDHAYYTSGES